MSNKIIVTADVLMHVSDFQINRIIYESLSRKISNTYKHMYVTCIQIIKEFLCYVYKFERNILFRIKFLRIFLFRIKFLRIPRILFRITEKIVKHNILSFLHLLSSFL